MKLLDWFKSAVAVVTTPAEQPKAEPQPRGPARNGGAPADAVPAAPPREKSGSTEPIAGTPPRPLDMAPAQPLRAEPETQIDVAPARPIEVAREDAARLEPEAAADSEPPISIEPRARAVDPSGPPDQNEVDRRRGLVRRFFNDYWSSVDEKPASFAERLDGAEGYINERVAAGGEAWQLDSATRKQLGLPQSKKQ